MMPGCWAPGLLQALISSRATGPTARTTASLPITSSRQSINSSRTCRWPDGRARRRRMWHARGTTSSPVSRRPRSTLSRRSGWRPRPGTSTAWSAASSSQVPRSSSMTHCRRPRKRSWGRPATPIHDFSRPETRPSGPLRNRKHISMPVLRPGLKTTQSAG